MPKLEKGIFFLFLMMFLFFKITLIESCGGMVIKFVLLQNFKNEVIFTFLTSNTLK